MGGRQLTRQVTGYHLRGGDGTVAFLTSYRAEYQYECMGENATKGVGMWTAAGETGLGKDIPVSQICAFNVLPSTLIDRVANSTPIVDFVSKLNSLRVKRESTEQRKDVEL